AREHSFWKKTDVGWTGGWKRRFGIEDCRFKILRMRCSEYLPTIVFRSAAVAREESVVLLARSRFLAHKSARNDNIMETSREPIRQTVPLLARAGVCACAPAVIP